MEPLGGGTLLVLILLIVGLVWWRTVLRLIACVLGVALLLGLTQIVTTVAQLGG